MAEMNEKDIIRGFEEIAEFDVGEDVVSRDIEDVRRLLESREHIAPPERESVWRIIMRSKWTKVSSAAAAIIIIVAISFNLLQTPKLEAAELLMQVAKNMEELAWIKTILKNYVPDKEEPISTDVHWSDMRNKRAYIVFNEKYIHLLDYRIGEWSLYNPDRKDMIIKPLKGQWASPSDELEKQIKMLEEEGIVVTQSRSTYNGRKVIVLEYDKINNYPGGDGPVTNMLMGGKYVKTVRYKIIIDDKDLLMGAGEVSYLDDEGNVIKTTRSESHVIETGPTDIYELGVPRDVKIVNKVPSRKVKQINQKISEHKSRFLDEYIAVITEAWIENGKETISEGFVIFSHGEKLRIDVYRALYGNGDEVTTRYRNDLAASLNCLEPYWPKHKRSIRSVRLKDGVWQYILEVEDGEFAAWEKQRRPEGRLLGDDDMLDFSWRLLWWQNDPEHMYEDDYSRANGLIAMELTSQSLLGQVPKRKVLYVDPEKDYGYKMI